MVKPGTHLRLYKNADFDKLNALIRNIDWNMLVNDASDVYHAEKKFTTTFLKLVKQCIPGKTVSIRPKDKAWFDSALRNKIRRRNRARNKALKTQNTS